MPRLISLMTKEERKIAWERMKSWTPEQRKLHALMLRQLRSGEFRPWEQLANYNSNSSTNH